MKAYLGNRSGKRNSIQTFLLYPFIFLVAVSLPLIANAKLKVIEGAPDNFGQLMVPRETVVTVSYGGEILGNYPARFTSENLMITNPEDLLNEIKDIKHRNTVLRALSGKLAVNTDKICWKENIEGCGQLEPEIAGVIFDERKLSAELFINKKYLDKTDSTGPSYLPLPEQDFSSVYNLIGAISGTEEAGNFAVTNNAVFAFGEKNLNTQFGITDEGFRLDTAALKQDRNGWETAGGLFRSRAMQLVTDADIAGLSYSTSLNTRLDNKKVEGSEIILYLPRRSLVSVYREGRLYSSGFYEAGNQYINTTELPQGAYNITLKIQEVGGATREETRFFAKAPEIPPPDSPIYYAQLGIIRDASSNYTFPEFTDKALLRLGTVRRVKENMGFDSSVLGLDERILMENGLFYIGPYLQLRTTFLASTENDIGAQTSAIYQIDDWSFVMDARKLSVEKDMNNFMTPLLQSLEQVTSTLSYIVTPDLTIGFRASYYSMNDIEQESYGPTMQWFIWREGEDNLTFNADVGKTNDELTANVFLRFSMRNGKWGLNTTNGVNSGVGPDGIHNNVRVYHDDTSYKGSRILGINALQDSNDTSIGLDGNVKNRLGQAYGTVQHNDGSSGSSISYSGNFNLNMAQSDYDLAIGGVQSNMSAVIIETEGDAKVPMKIYVNGSERSMVDANSSQTLYLQPYQIYNISLGEIEKSFIEYDSGRRKVILYPGNVVRLKWRINNFYVVLAYIIDENGEPLRNAILLEGDLQQLTTETGRLQAQIAKRKKLNFQKTSGEKCSVKLKNIKSKDGVLIYKKPLICRYN